jgi:hypothetical protein
MKVKMTQIFYRKADICMCIVNYRLVYTYEENKSHTSLFLFIILIISINKIAQYPYQINK